VIASTHGGSAEIIEFPSRHRRNIAALQKEAMFAHESVTQQGQDIVWGSDWYHQEAIREADRLGKS
jgi:hypothetical protein